MKIQLKIIAVLFVFLGVFSLFGFLAGLYSFSNSELFVWQSSVLDSSGSFFGRIGNLWSKYFEFLKYYGMNGYDLLFSFAWIILSFTFAIGLLKNKKWAINVGFVIVGLNVLGFLLAIYDQNISAAYFIQLVFAAYLFFVLTSARTKELLT